MSITLKTYTVRFTSITSYKLRLRARTARSAIAKAKRQWFYGGDLAADFVAFSSEDHGWDAYDEEVRS